MDKDYAYIILERKNKESSKAITKILRNNKDKFKVVKHLDIGRYSIYRIYKSTEKYQEHKAHTIDENREHFLEMDFDSLDVIQADVIRRLILDTDFSEIEDDSELAENILLNNLVNDEKKNFIYYDKKEGTLYLGKFGKSSPVFELKGEMGTTIITNSEFIKEKLKETFEVTSVINGEDVIYALSEDGILKRSEAQKEEIIEPEEPEEDFKPELPKEFRNFTPRSTTGIESILKKGEFLTEEVYPLNPSLGREEEIRELEKNLMIPKKGVILVGKSGVGKTAIVRGLAYKIKTKEVCDKLKNKEIFSISTTSLIAGTKYRGDLEEKVEKLCSYIKTHPEIILFIDEIQAGINDNNYESNSLGIADILKPYISEGHLKMIGATTDEEFSSLKSNGAFLRRFNILEVEELDKEKLMKILIEHIYFNEFNIDINMSEEDIQKFCNIVIKLSHRKPKYIYKERSNPDSSINIIDSCFAYLAVNNIKSAKYKDFIDGIIDNKNLSITEFDYPMFGIIKVENNETTKIIKLTKNNLL